jgi:hypothetical protein
MSQDSELVGVGLAFITVAVVICLLLSGSVDPYSLRVDLIRFFADVGSALSSASALL